MQAASDVFLGWVRVEEDIDGHRRDYYVRQLWDAKASMPIETMSSAELTDYAAVCGWTLARAHARSGDPAAIAAASAGRRLRPRDGALRQGYAAQNEATTRRSSPPWSPAGCRHSRGSEPCATSRSAARASASARP